MARTSRPSRPPARGGHLRLLLGLGAGGLLATYLFAPELIHSLVPKPAAPGNAGSAPAVTGLAEARVNDRTVRLQPIPPTVESLAQRRETVSPTARTTTVRTPEVSAAPLRGSEGLARAQAAFDELRFDEAQRLAGSLIGIGADPAVSAKAQQLAKNAQALSELFARLGDRRELARSIDTHPSLVLVTVNGREAPLLPVDNISDKNPVESPDPVTWVRNTMATGSVAFLAPPGGIATAYKGSDIAAVRAADVASTQRERQGILDARLERFLASPDLQRDPMAWYEAGRYAYQNRLDKRVAELLSRALLLEPDLASAIREDAAAAEFANLTKAMEDKNATRAAGFMAYLRKNYQDTRVFAQAEAYYSGNVEAMAAARAKDEQALAARKSREQEILENVKRSGDQVLAEAIQRSQAERPTTDESSELPALGTGAGGRASEADGYMAKGDELLAKAMGMPANAARDSTYAQAKPWFDKAIAIYNAEVKKGNKSLEPKLVLATRGRFMALKYQRAFH